MSRRGARGALQRLPMVLAIVVALWLTAGLAAAQGPTVGPSPEPVMGTGDPRSEGEGPGLRGSPLEVALGVVIIGALAAGATMVLVRLRRDDS